MNKFCYTFVVELKARKEVKRICSLIVAVLAVTMCCGASEMSQDSAMVEMRDSLTKRPGLVKRILKYFDDPSVKEGCIAAIRQEKERLSWNTFARKLENFIEAL